MTLEEIEKLWQKDCVIDSIDLGAASLNIPKLHSKYYSVLLREQKVHQRLVYQLQELEHILDQFYNRKLSDEELEEYGLGEYPDQKIMKGDVSKWVSSHKDVIRIKTSIGLQLSKIDYLKSILKEVSNMSFQIKNAIEWEKFRSGA